MIRLYRQDVFSADYGILHIPSESQNNWSLTLIALLEVNHRDCCREEVDSLQSSVKTELTFNDWALSFQAQNLCPIVFLSFIQTDLTFND